MFRVQWATINLNKFDSEHSNFSMSLFKYSIASAISAKLIHTNFFFYFWSQVSNAGELAQWL